MIVDCYIALEYDAIDDKAEYFSLHGNDWGKITETLVMMKNNG